MRPMFTGLLCLVLALGACALPDDPVRFQAPTELEPILVLGEAPDPATLSEVEFLYKPSSVAFDQNETIYVLDAGNQRVAVFEKDGSYLRDIGRSGGGPGELFVGRDSEDEIAVFDDRLVVHEKQRMRIQIFDLSGEYISSFLAKETLTSIAFDGRHLYGATNRSGSGVKDLVVYDLQGVEIRSLGDGLLDRIDEAGNMQHHLNRYRVAVDDSGNIRQAFWLLPLVRTIRPDGTQEERWYDFSWSTDGYLQEIHRDRYSRESLDTLQQGGTVEGPRFVGVAFDLEYAPLAGRWVTLMGRGRVQVFDKEGDPAATYLLLRAEWEQDFDAPYGTSVTKEHAIGSRGIAVSEDGRFLCAADYEDSVVRCYAIPPEPEEP